MQNLTELNDTYTYLERCQRAAKQFHEQRPENSLESRNFNSNPAFWARLIADSWQVAVVDMLAETNKQWR